MAFCTIEMAFWRFEPPDNIKPAPAYDEQPLSPADTPAPAAHPKHLHHKPKPLHHEQPSLKFDDSDGGGVDPPPTHTGLYRCIRATGIGESHLASVDPDCEVGTFMRESTHGCIGLGPSKRSKELHRCVSRQKMTGGRNKWTHSVTTSGCKEGAFQEKLLGFVQAKKPSDGGDWVQLLHCQVKNADLAASLFAAGIHEEKAMIAAALESSDSEFFTTTDPGCEGHLHNSYLGWILKSGCGEVTDLNLRFIMHSEFSSGQREALPLLPDPLVVERPCKHNLSEQPNCEPAIRKLMAQKGEMGLISNYPFLKGITRCEAYALIRSHTAYEHQGDDFPYPSQLVPEEDINSSCGSDGCCGCTGRCNQCHRGLPECEADRGQPWPADPGGGVLTFQTCGGFANQRSAIVTGIQIGKLLGWTVLLPTLNTNGEQTGATYDEKMAVGVDFDAFYDTASLVSALPDIRFQLKDDTNSDWADIGIAVTTQMYDPDYIVRTIIDMGQQSKGGRVRLPCTMMAMRLESPKLEQAYWQINSALVPNPRLLSIILQVHTALNSRGWFASVGAASVGDRFANTEAEDQYIVLHVRTEKDWIEHCARWGSAINWNCMGSSEPSQLKNALHAQGVDIHLPVYVCGGDFKGAGSQFQHLYTKDTLIDLKKIGVSEQHRELRALIDYYIASKATYFIGNSVSTFSAHLLMERAATCDHCVDLHYNGGNVPMSQMVFRHPVPQNARLKWVFVVNSMTPAYYYLIQLAVSSALEKTSLIPVCIFTGKKTWIYNWLEDQGVRIIMHQPAWRGKLREAYEVAKRQQLHITSTNYKSYESMLATFLRFDLPILGLGDDFVLYADTDILFLRDITLTSFNSLPEWFMIGAEAEKDRCKTDDGQLSFGNAGVMLFNVPNMKSSHQIFVDWVFSPRNIASGLHFKELGPLDQGAYNTFYNREMDCKTSPFFNWKPYWGPNSDAAILHFHGPKYLDYIEFIEKGTASNENFMKLLQRCDLGCRRYIQEMSPQADSFIKDAHAHAPIDAPTDAHTGTHTHM